jgi:hypothetical protein
MDTWPPPATSAVSTFRVTSAASASQVASAGPSRRATAPRKMAIAAVGSDVRQVSVQRQCGHGAPPLAVQHARGVGGAPFDEVPRRAEAGIGGEGEERESHGRAGEGPSVIRPRDQPGSRRVLGFPRGERCLRRRRVPIIDNERPAPVRSRLDVVRDTHRLEDDAPLQRGVVVVLLAQQRHAAKVRGFAAHVERHHPIPAEELRLNAVHHATRRRLRPLPIRVEDLL